MHQAANTVDITISSLGGLGDGVASYKGKPLFVPKACAGDHLKVVVTRENKEAAFGEIVEVLRGGADRQAAACKHFAACGGCSLQQLTPESYRAFKTTMLRESIARAGYEIDADVYFLDAPTRRRVDFKVYPSQLKSCDGYTKTVAESGCFAPQSGRTHANSWRAKGIEQGALAFHAMRSHTLVPVTECPVLTPELQALMAPLVRALATLPFAHDIAGVSLTQADKGVDVLLTTRHIPKLPPMEAFCKTLGVARVAVHSGNTKPRIGGSITPVQMQLGASLIDLAPDAFLQATKQGQTMLTKTALEAVGASKKVVDLFAGIGTYSFPLAAQARVHAVEGEVDMVRAITTNATKLGMKQLTAERRDLFKQPISVQELKGFDAAIINPPRTGAKAQVEQLAQSEIATVVMISCNPATFGRDAKTLKDAGFSLVSAYGLDQFVWSTHLEIAAVFRR
jgi:23S rRNA (uracil1939-C5)-methyltransferase